MGGGILNTTPAIGPGSHPLVANCIFWGNLDGAGTNRDESAQIRDASGSNSTVTYSIIQRLDSFAGIGNLDLDPMFVNAWGADRIPGTEDDDLRLATGSPAIDAGDNLAVLSDFADLDGDGNTSEPTPFDLDGNPRFVDDPATMHPGNAPIVDIGAYEFQE